MPSTVCGLSLPEILWRMSAPVSIASPPAASVSSISRRSRGCADSLKNSVSGRMPAPPAAPPAGAAVLANQPRGQGVRGRAEDQRLGQNPRLARLGQDPQPLGEEAP